MCVLQGWHCCPVRRLACSSWKPCSYNLISDFKALTVWLCGQIRDYWTPSDQSFLDDNDLDFGSAVPIPVLNGKYLFVGGKEGTLYLLNSTALGGYNANNNDANARSVIPPNKNDEPGTNGIYRCTVQPHSFRGFMEIWPPAGWICHNRAVAAYGCLMRQKNN